MHVLIVNFNLKDVDEAQYARMCDAVAPAFAAIPGLASKLWLKNSDTGTYGGVYIFESRDALNRFQETGEASFQDPSIDWSRIRAISFAYPHGGDWKSVDAFDPPAVAAE